MQVPDPLIASSIDISKNMKYYEKERVGEEEGRDGGGDVRHYEHEDGTPAGSPHRHRSRRDPDAASPSHRSYARSSPSRYSSSLNSAGTYPCHIPLNSMYQDSNPLGSSIMSSQVKYLCCYLSYIAPAVHDICSVVDHVSKTVTFSQTASAHR